MKGHLVVLVSLLMLYAIPSFSQSYTTEKTTSAKVQKIIAKVKGPELQDKLDECLKLLSNAISIDPNCIDLYELQGTIYFALNRYPESIAPMLKVTIMNPDYKPKLFYFLAVSYWETDSLTKAIDAANKYLRSKGTYDVWAADAKRIINNSGFAIEAIKHPVPFNPVNLGDSINTPDLDEYSPSISIDNSVLIFNRNMQGPRGHQEDFYESHNVNGTWSKAKDVGAPLNTEFNEGAQKLSADGNTLYFTICDKPGVFGSCDIYTATWNGTNWINIRNAGFPVSLPNWESQPSISADGRDLYFASEGRPGSVGGKDIYVSHKQADGAWGIPQDLGNVINTPNDEGYPYIHPDNQTLYFCSNGHPGMGGSDLYMSRKGPDGKWGTPINIGYPVNTKRDEYCLIVSIDGKTAYYASTPQGRKDLDLYKFDLPENVRPIPATYVKGIVKDKATGKTLTSEVQLIDLATSKIVMNVQSANDGSFLETLPAGKNYALNISKPGYLFYSENFSLKEPADIHHPFTIDIELEAVAVGNSVILKNIFFDVNQSVLKDESKTELEKLVAFLNSNPKIKIEIGGHTDNTGTDAANKTLSENRAKAVYDYLVAAKIDASRLSYKGYGSTKPIADNSTEEGKAQNRRTEFQIIAVQ